MNYLAHLYLSAESVDEQLGGLMADFVKGQDDVAKLPPGVQVGIRLHRQVDAFTDGHPAVHRSIRRIADRWGWFSGIIIDIFYDYLLIRSWADHTIIPLDTFISEMYAHLTPAPEWMDPAMRLLADRLVAHDRLTSYGEIAGIEDTLFRVSQRIAERMPKRAMPLEQSIADLLRHEHDLAADFAEFFPDICRFVASRGGRGSDRGLSA